MQIILLHPRFMAKSLTLGTRHFVLVILLFVMIVTACAAFLSLMALRHASEIQLPFLQTSLATYAQDQDQKKDKYVKENLAAMAMKLGEMQAQLMRLDSLGERVQGLAGIKPQEFNFREKPGRGGPGSSSGERKQYFMSMPQFKSVMDELAKDLEYRADYLNVVETSLMNDKINSKLLPTIRPVNVSYNASGFGWRPDPFTGQQAFHEGLDFAAPTGTPIMAAAGGVVIAAEYHHEFGNMLEVDHGNGIVTRYGHNSRLLAKVGDIVKRGQLVANVGSTGRSTGPHLHFEVLVRGTQQDPQKFLAAGADQARISAQAKR